jgi:17 kDa outer membrane surface antigen
MIGFKRENGELFACARGLRKLLPMLGLAAIGLSGCSFSMSLPSFLHDDETGSIKPQRSPLSDQLDDKDWKIARPALAKVVSAAEDQPPVAWSNPDTGRGGLFQSVGIEFTREGRQCRAFVAGVSGDESKSMLQGVGCLTAQGDVVLANVGPWKGP